MELTPALVRGFDEASCEKKTERLRDVYSTVKGLEWAHLLSASTKK